ATDKVLESTKEKGATDGIAEETDRKAKATERFPGATDKVLESTKEKGATDGIAEETDRKAKATERFPGATERAIETTETLHDLTNRRAAAHNPSPTSKKQSLYEGL
ncbi:hypothetical protein, partial [Lysinibacillus xylanilyticus]|uniref:hypothetical protein n=1 Tax=Lysinibacillus xylanilyticus TaxID=582475 RepID=UPI003CFD14C5